MSKYFLFSFLLTLIISCSKDMKEDKKLESVVKAFSKNLYVNYHLFSKRERKDNTGKFKGTWPRTITVDDPHDVVKAKRKKQREKDL